MGGGGGGENTNGMITFTWWDGMPTPGEAIIIYSSGVGIIIQHYHTTWNTVIAALNAWCAANLSGSATYGFTLGDPTNDGPKELSQYQQQMSMNGNGQSEQFFLKAVDANGVIKATTLY